MKKWYLSKTLWVNAIGLIALVVQTITGRVIISPEVQGMILTVANVILRLVTKQELIA
jgi:hypothetical protein